MHAAPGCTLQVLIAAACRIRDFRPACVAAPWSAHWLPPQTHAGHYMIFTSPGCHTHAARPPAWYLHGAEWPEWTLCRIADPPR
eukprot:15478322-Alexandrium_andersonii.AAC.1